MTLAPGGKYEELPELHVGEPWFIFRAQDALAPHALTNYAALLRAAAAGVEAGAEGRMLTVRLREQAVQVEQHAAQMVAWQSANHVRLPT